MFCQGTPANPLVLNAIMNQALRAIKAVHSARMVHRFIAPESFFIAQLEPMISIKLGNFNFAELADGDELCPADALWPRLHTAPELRVLDPASAFAVKAVKVIPKNHHPYAVRQYSTSTRYGPAVDIWSFGTTLLECSGYLPIVPFKNHDRCGSFFWQWIMHGWGDDLHFEKKDGPLREFTSTEMRLYHRDHIEACVKATKRYGSPRTGRVDDPERSKAEANHTDTVAAIRINSDTLKQLVVIDSSGRLGNPNTHVTPGPSLGTRNGIPREMSEARSAFLSIDA